MNNGLEVFKLKFLLFACAMIVFAGSCKDECEEDCAGFSNFSMCDTAPSSDGCNGDANVFAQDADFLTVSVEITEGEPTDELSVRYFINDGSAFVQFNEQSVQLQDLDGIDGDEARITASTGLQRKAGELWPIADYKVEIELSQEIIPLNETRNFSIE